MATTAEELIVKITAKLDQAVADTKRYQQQLDQLEDGAEVPVTAKVKGANDIDDLMAKVDRLERDPATLLLDSNAVRVTGEIGDLLAKVDQLDANDPRVDIELANINQLQGNLDQIEAKAKAINDVPIEPGRGGNPRAGFDKIIDGADQANSATANMVGNASQDLGQLVGISGSAGVALGQLTEYMTDTGFAAKAAGQSLGTMFKSFATASLPIAAISLVTIAISDIIAKSGEMGRKINEASKIAVSSMLDVAEAGGKLGEGLDDVAESAVTKIFEELGAKTPGVVKALEAVGITWDEVVEGFRTGGGDMADLLREFSRFDVGKSLFGERQAKLDLGERLGLTPAAVDELVGRMRLIDDAFGESFRIQDEANEAGRAAGEYRGEAADATEAQAEAEGKLAEEAAKSTEEIKAQEAAAREAADAMSAWAVKVLDAEGALGELAGTFSQMGLRGDALSAIFDLGNAPLEAAASVRDITIAIGDLSDKAKGISGKQIMLGDVKADELLDSIDALRPQIQAKVVEAFSGGGDEAAVTMANSYIDQVTKELGGKLTRDEVAKLLGLENIEATVRVAVEQSDIESARQQLAILTGLGGETPYTASIALALEAGSITGAQAQALIQPLLADAGVTVPSELAVPTTPEVVAEAQASLDAGKPVELPTSADITGGLDDINAFRDDVEGTTVTAPVDAEAKEAERKAKAFRDATERTKAIAPVDTDTAAALITMAYIKVFAALLRPVVTVTADTGPAQSAINGIRGTRVPVEAYLSDYPSASEIQQRIGRPRIPVDIVVGSSIRITGVRD